MVEATKKARPRRASINGTRNILNVSGKDPNFEYRIVNDTGDRIALFEEAGYELVTDSKIKVGDRRLANPTKEGSPVKVSVGGGQQAFLMRIPKEFYAEDQEKKNAYVDEQEKGMIREAKANSDYGKLEVSR